MPEEVKQTKPVKSKLFITSTIMFTLMMVVATVALLLIVFPILIGCLWLIYGCLVVILTICTLSLIWWAVEDKGWFLPEMKEWLLSLNGFIDKSLKLAPWFLIAAGVFCALSIVFSAIGLKTGDKKCKPMLIVSIVYPSVIVIVFVVALLIAGNA